MVAEFVYDLEIRKAVKLDWLVGWFYGMSILELFYAEVSLIIMISDYIG